MLLFAKYFLKILFTMKPYSINTVFTRYYLLYYFCSTTSKTHLSYDCSTTHHTVTSFMTQTRCPSSVYYSSRLQQCRPFTLTSINNMSLVYVHTNIYKQMHLHNAQTFGSIKVSLNTKQLYLVVTTCILCNMNSACV